MFYCLTALGLHQTLGFEGGAPAFAAVLADLFLLCSIALWVLADARRRRRQLPYDFGSFVFFAELVFVPIYLFTTRGWRAFATFGWFLLLYIAAAVVSVIPWLLSSK